MEKLNTAVLSVVFAALAGCASTQLGGGNTAATGAAAGETAHSANSQLERCDGALGTLVVVEDTQAPWFRTLTAERKLGPTTPVLKLLVQQSNCFVVVERGRVMSNMAQERSLESSGEMRQGSNFGRGQVVAADFSLSPSITFSNANAGRASGGISNLVPGATGRLLGSVSGSASVKEASTMLTLVDNRSSVQLAAAQGSASNVDFGAFGGGFTRALSGTGGGYSNTAEGKVIVAAFTDSYNNLVKAVRNYKAQDVKGGLGKGGRLEVK